MRLKKGAIQYGSELHRQNDIQPIISSKTNIQ
jgi:hypothetical protein